MSDLPIPVVNYDDRLHRCFHEGRRHVESVMRLWRNRIRACVGRRSGLMVLDLGSGTGRFSTLLADELDSEVVGVEPSDKMRNTAQEECTDSRVRFIKGAAHEIPLRDGSCDVAWLSQMLHHLPDIEAAARELGRVVRRRGLVIIRNNFKGRLKGFCRYYEFFPTGLAVDEARHPTIEQIRQCFGDHGFRFVSWDVVEQTKASSLKEYAQRIRLRTYSTFELLSETEFEEGLRAVQKAAQAETRDHPVMAKIDLLVFERR